MKMIHAMLDRLRDEPKMKALKKNGLEVGKNFSYGHHCFFDPAHCFLISIGDNVTFSSKVHVLAHDASTKRHIGYAKIGRVKSGNKVFIGANATILPGVTIGDRSIIGAGAVVSKDVEADSVYAGVPARRICSLDEYLSKISEIEPELWFEEDYTVRGGITKEKKERMKALLDGGKIGLVR